MTAPFPLIPARTGAHRAPLQCCRASASQVTARVSRMHQTVNGAGLNTIYQMVGIFERMER